jgi:hypothetical protein
MEVYLEEMKKKEEEDLQLALKSNNVSTVRLDKLLEGETPEGSD